MWPVFISYKPHHTTVKVNVKVTVTHSPKPTLAFYSELYSFYQVLFCSDELSYRLKVCQWSLSLVSLQWCCWATIRTRMQEVETRPLTGTYRVLSCYIVWWECTSYPYQISRKTFGSGKAALASGNLIGFKLSWSLLAGCAFPVLP